MIYHFLANAIEAYGENPTSSAQRIVGKEITRADDQVVITVTDNGGRIEAASTAGATCFTVTLPAPG